MSFVSKRFLTKSATGAPSPTQIWTAATLPTLSLGNVWLSSAYGNGRFVAISTTTDIAAYSDDGITWTQTSLPSVASWSSVTYGGGRFVAIAGFSGNTDIAAYSDDGITWIQATLPASSRWWSVTYGNGRFVAVNAFGQEWHIVMTGLTGCSRR
jgi:hypothetical protein